MVVGPHDGLVMVHFFVFAQVVLATEGLFFCTLGIFTVVVGQQNERTRPCHTRRAAFCWVFFLDKRGSRFALCVRSQKEAVWLMVTCRSCPQWLKGKEVRTEETKAVKRSSSVTGEVTLRITHRLRLGCFPSAPGLWHCEPLFLEQ